MENPYKLSNDRVIDILELVPCGAEEALVQAGYAAGKAEQAEIVTEYREALEWIAAGKAGRTTPAACMAATVTRAKAALAKATQ